MNTKATAIAPSNIAFIKYWGKKEESLRLAKNGSISMNLSNLTATTTIEFDSKYESDNILFNGIHDVNVSNRVSQHLDKIRKFAKINKKAKVIIENNFPVATGLSASASVFASLTVAGCASVALKLSEKDISILARQGSGSACRSIPSGFVEWRSGKTSETSYAYSLYPPDYWEVYDVVVIVSKAKKEIGSTEGQSIAKTSPFFQTRLKDMDGKIKLCKEILKRKNFTQLGELVESEALEMHAIMLTSTPSLIYWTSGTLEIMKLTKIWRKEGLEVYFTINTGQDVHLIVQSKDVSRLKTKLEQIESVRDIIINTPCGGAHLIDKHLF